MDDVLNYRVVTVVGEKAPLLNWVAAEAEYRVVCEDAGESLNFKFASLDDAFRFRMQFDELLAA